ncbi:eCIS core domain-containing protein [Streptomyces californicus]|uniref:eCIS core domain-containing protein n=1 Tax=Streptomyces californicus TaxID=67351 RepID=UPI00067A7B78
MPRARGHREAEPRAAAETGRRQPGAEVEAVAPHGGTALSPLNAMALQRTIGNRAVAGLIAAPAAPASEVADVLAQPGSPIDTPLREEMEARLDADFSTVRVHDGLTARRSAAEVDARAYTSGEHIVIGEGGGDRHTIAHELEHVK